MPIKLMPLSFTGMATPEEFAQGTQGIPAGWPGSDTITFGGKPISTSGLSGVASSAVTRVATSAVDYLLKDLLKDWIGARGITLILGLMFIAAAIFTHPAVVQTVRKVGKTAAEAAVAA